MQLLYIHDPMCSWCWGYKPTFEQLKASLPTEIELVYLMGGLAPDNDQPMPKEMQRKLEQVWRTIEQKLGTEFNYDFWSNCQPVRTTYSACRAVLAAGYQGRYVEMIGAIQEAYYLRAMNPHTQETHILLAKELGLDLARFEHDVASAELEHEFALQRAYCRSIGATSYPTLLARTEQGEILPVAFSYTDAFVTLNDLKRLVAV